MHLSALCRTVFDFVPSLTDSVYTLSLSLPPRDIEMLNIYSILQGANSICLE